MNNKNIIIGTAGHIDHGKTTLIKAITGRNTDRLKEEQKRGISIELGFTHFDLDENLKVGIIDVPGHEKFIKNMLSGICGMDMIILVIAADEGIMAQTKEHLDILNLIGIKNGIIALTKCDVVDEEWKELVKLDIKDQVKGTFLENSKIIEVSSTKNIGIEELKSEIKNIIDTIPNKSENEIPRLFVDRSFTITGFGTIVTGTLMTGKLEVDQEIFIYPSKKVSKIRNLQVHDTNVKIAYAGQRVAINLSNVKKDDVPKGSVIIKDNTFAESSMIDVRLNTLELPFNIENRTRFHLYTGSTEVLCRLALLEDEYLESNKSYIVQLRLESPIISKRNDKFILRLFSPLYTIGGGYIIDSNPLKKRKNNIEDINNIKNIENISTERYIYNYIDRFSKELYYLKDYYKYFSDTNENIKTFISELIQKGKIYSFGNSDDILVVSNKYVEKLKINIKNYIKEYHEQYPKRIGVLKETIKSKFFDSLSGRIKNEFSSFILDDEFNTSGDYVYLSDFIINLDKDDNENIKKILNIFSKDKYSIISIEDISLNLKINDLKEYIVYLISINKIIKLDTGYMIYENYLDSINIIKEFILKNGSISLGDARDILNSNRKSTMELLEFFDKEKITKRKDNERILV